MCTLVARIVKLRPVTVTFFTVPSTYDRIQAEIGRDFRPEDQHLLSRIRQVFFFRLGVHDEANLNTITP